MYALRGPDTVTDLDVIEMLEGCSAQLAPAIMPHLISARAAASHNPAASQLVSPMEVQLKQLASSAELSSKGGKKARTGKAVAQEQLHDSDGSINEQVDQLVREITGQYPLNADQVSVLAAMATAQTVDQSPCVKQCRSLDCFKCHVWAGGRASPRGSMVQDLWWASQQLSRPTVPHPRTFRHWQELVAECPDHLPGTGTHKVAAGWLGQRPACAGCCAHQLCCGSGAGCSQGVMLL